mgnify:FL=1
MEYKTIISNPQAAPGSAFLGAIFGQNMPKDIGAGAPSVPGSVGVTPGQSSGEEQQSILSELNFYKKLSLLVYTNEQINYNYFVRLV